MGFRFYRREKLFGGLGLNFSKSGVSWSIRTKGGSFGPKRASVRTGIPGLTYVVGRPRRKITVDEGFNLFRIIGRVIWTCFYAFLGSAIVFVFFPQHWTAYKYLVIAYIVLVPCWPIVMLLFQGLMLLFEGLLNVGDFFYDLWISRKQNNSVNHSERIEQHVTSRINSSYGETSQKQIYEKAQPEVTNEKQNNFESKVSAPTTISPQYYTEDLSLSSSWELTIYNLINDILDKAAKFETENIKVNELIQETFFNKQEDCIRVILAYDLVTASEYLEIAIEDESIEALIILFSIGIITEKELCFKMTATNIHALKKMYYSLLKHKEWNIITNNDNILLSQQIYKNEPDKLFEYNDSFKQLLNLITSADLEITAREKKLLNFVKTKPRIINS